MESLKRALEQIGRLWSSLNATQKVILSAGAVVMALLLFWGTSSTTETWVRISGPEVDASKRHEMLQKFQAQNQKHEVRGSEIFVPKQDADRIVLEMAGDGTMSNSSVWKFLEQSDIFATRWDKEKRLQIALQTRLEGMIRSIESVKNAAVVINPGSTHHQLGFAGPKPSASVQVELKEGMGLSRKNVQAIAGLVARAVSGVEEDQVHIMDTKANSYRAAKPNPDRIAAEGMRDIEMQVEESILRGIKGSPFFEGASVVVRVKAKSSSSDTDQLEHGKATVIEEQESKRVKKGSGGSRGSGVKKGEGDAESVVEPSGREDETETQSNQKSVVGSKRTVEHNPAGDIERVTVGVLIPVEEGPKMAEAERQLPKLRSFVQAAAGPQARTEDISVQLIPTKKPEPVAAAVEQPQAWDWIAARWSKIVLGALAVAALLIILRVLQGAMAKDTVEELQALTTALTETQEAQAELAAPAETDLARLKSGIQDMVGRNPQTVAASLKSFMSGR